MADLGILWRSDEVFTFLIATCIGCRILSLLFYSKVSICHSIQLVAEGQGTEFIDIRVPWWGCPKALAAALGTEAGLFAPMWVSNHWDDPQWGGPFPNSWQHQAEVRPPNTKILAAMPQQFPLSIKNCGHIFPSHWLCVWSLVQYACTLCLGYSM